MEKDLSIEEESCKFSNKKEMKFEDNINNKSLISEVELLSNIYNLKNDVRKTKIKANAFDAAAIACGLFTASQLLINNYIGKSVGFIALVTAFAISSVFSGDFKEKRDDLNKQLCKVGLNKKTTTKEIQEKLNSKQEELKNLQTEYNK